MSAETISAASLEPPWLHVRREPFEYGLLPLPSLIINEGVSAFKNLRTKLLEHVLSSPSWPTSNAAGVNDGSQVKLCKNRVASAGIGASLGLQEAHAHLVLDTLASVLPDEGGDCDPLARSRVLDTESVGADVDDLILLLYIQTYKRVPPRHYKDPAAVADVWPTPSVFDGYLTPTSPLQNRSSRRAMPCLAEEEGHQLAFVRKHLPSILALLAESTEDGDQEAKVITLEKFQHLSLLIRAADASTGCLPLSQATPFFANSDPDMPAAPVPLSQVLDWMVSHLCAASERTPIKAPVKDSVFHDSDGSESDVPMADACVTGTTNSPSGGLTTVSNGFQTRKDWRPEGVTFIDGVMKASVLKTEADVKNGSAKVAHCHDSVVYVLGPLKYVSVFGCSDSIVVLGAVGKAVRVELCERVQIIVASARICISNCRECVFYLGVNQRPLITGDNHNLQVAPYNTTYSNLEADLAQVGIDTTVNKWDRVLTLGVVDPHDSVSHPAGVADAQAEGASLFPPERFLYFVIPRWNEAEHQQQQQPTAETIPFPLPKAYSQAQQHRTTAAESLKQTLKNVVLEENRKRDLTNAIHAYFKDWLYSTGNIRQIYDLQSLERDPKAMD